MITRITVKGVHIYILHIWQCATISIDLQEKEWFEFLFSTVFWLPKKYHASLQYFYTWMGKTLDILASTINSTYNVDKMHNSILKIPWFCTPASHFHETDMTPWARFPCKNWQWLTHSTLFAAVFPPTPRLKYLGNTISRKLPVRETSGVYFI